MGQWFLGACLSYKVVSVLPVWTVVYTGWCVLSLSPAFRTWMTLIELLITVIMMGTMVVSVRSIKHWTVSPSSSGDIEWIMRPVEFEKNLAGSVLGVYLIPDSRQYRGGGHPLPWHGTAWRCLHPHGYLHSWSL